MSLYASRDGALYQSYDDFAGMQGFYEGQDGSQAYDPYAGFMQPSKSQVASQAQISVQQPIATRNSYGPGFYQGDMPTATTQRVPVIETMMVPVSMAMGMQKQAVSRAAPSQINHYEPVHFSSNLRGVGIKFGERIDSQSGGMHVYVKRVVPGSPADKASSNPPGHRIQPGDSLLLINGEDVYGLGLDVLRERIPGPVGTVVTLGFKSLEGDLFEVELVRSAYAVGADAMQEQNSLPEHQGETSQLRVPRIGRPHQQRRNPNSANSFQDNIYASVADGGYAPTFTQRPASGAMQGGQGMIAGRTMQVPMMAQNTVAVPVSMDSMSQTVVAQPQFYDGESSYFAVVPAQQAYPGQYQLVPAPEYPMQVQASSQFSGQQLVYSGQQQYLASQTQYAPQTQFAPQTQYTSQPPYTPRAQYVGHSQYQYAPQMQVQSMPSMVQMIPMQGMTQPSSQNPYGQPASQNPYGQPASQNPYGQPSSQNPYAQMQMSYMQQ